MNPVQLSVLDPAPVSSGSTVGQSLRDTLDLAQRVESLGYQRYWLAGYHLARGLAGAAPQALIALVAAVTSRIRVGSGAAQTGHGTSSAIVEQFGAVDAFYPGRIDLGLGRFGQLRAERCNLDPRPQSERLVDGLPIPRPFDSSILAASPAMALFARLLRQWGAQSPGFADQVDEIAELLGGACRPVHGDTGYALPGAAADLELWVLGGCGGQRAQVAGERGLRFAVGRNLARSDVLREVDAYRAAFKPSAALDEPYVLVSADVVAGPDDASADWLAAPYGLWARGISTEANALPFLTPQEVAAHRWAGQDRWLVADRVGTRFVGSPATVAERLRVLQRDTGADELLVTTITHDHADRVRSFELLAAEWNRG